MAIGSLPGFNAEQAMTHLAAIVESSEDAIIGKTLEGTILTWNAGAEHVYGYSAAEAIGRPMTLLLPEDRPDEEAEILDRIRQGQRVEHFETVRRRKNDERIDVSLTISPIRDRSGRIVGASHVARDITDRRRLDEQLRHLAAIVESSADAIVSKTLEGTIFTWNAGAEDTYGYTAEEAIGRHMSLLLPADRPDEEAEILDRIGRGQSVEHFETVRRRKNGDLIDVSLTISPVRDQSGRVVGASHVARDITERKRLEEQLRHTQKLEGIGVLAGGVAHDFNNLLTGILGNTSLAMEDLPARRPDSGSASECAQLQRAGGPPDTPVARLRRQGAVRHRTRRCFPAGSRDQHADPDVHPQKCKPEAGAARRYAAHPGRSESTAAARHESGRQRRRGDPRR